MPGHGLSERHIGIIRAILAPYADRIERVDLFGSRATGAYRPRKPRPGHGNASTFSARSMFMAASPPGFRFIRSTRSN
jgi:hypothetical protein